MAGEFDLIATYFLPLAEGRSEAANFQNDAALLDVPEGMQLAVTSDTLNADVHFFAGQKPDTIAKKALRTNISDLIAMGARPYCYQLNIALPVADAGWIAAFSAALAEENRRYGVFCSGGDTTSVALGGGVSIAIAAFGLVERGRAVMRGGAQAGDVLMLSGTVGDAWCGLQSLRGALDGVCGSCVDLYYAPEPPLALVPVLARYAKAALDISDGLAADLSHLARASNARAVVEAGSIVFSPAVTDLLGRGAVDLADVLSGGDDYQILCAAAPESAQDMMDMAAENGVSLQVIGRFEAGAPEVVVLDADGRAISVACQGWQHFQK